MPNAIVTGATGILGREIVAELGKHPEQWPKVHALSRSKKDELPENVKHSFIDLQASSDEMAKELKDVEGEYVFFAAYLQKDTEQQNWQVNGDMISNFLSALEATGAASKIKRVVLVTGAKQYGVHLGQTKNPMEETDPWLRDKKFPPNFYYRQQDVLKEFCGRNPHISWVVTYPNDVIGFAKGNFMNMATSIGIYAAIAKELGKDLVFPGSPSFYTKFDCFTWSVLHAQFCIWAALEPKAGNQAFNVVNGDTESWQNLFPRLAKRFGLKVKANQFADLSAYDSKVTYLSHEVPISETAAEMGLVGAVAPSKVEQIIDLSKWTQNKTVTEAWDKLAEREGLEKDAFQKATWDFLGFVLGRKYDLVISMSKARSFGWTGYKDTWQALNETLDKLEDEKILPMTRS